MRTTRPVSMRRLLACAGVNGDETALKRLVKVSEEVKPHAILFAGGIVAPGSSGPGRAEFINKFFEALGKSGHFAAVIPGPHDVPLWEFCRVAVNTEVVFPNIFAVHATPVSRSDIAVSGMGGLLTEMEDSGNPILKYSHPSAEYFLRSLWYIDKPVKVLLLSEPPPGRLAGNGGNRMVHELIKSYHPSICIVQGKREHRGWEQIASTLVVNPGLLVEGSAAWIDRVTRDIEMLDL